MIKYNFTNTQNEKFKRRFYFPINKHNVHVLTYTHADLTIQR